MIGFLKFLCGFFLLFALVLFIEFDFLMAIILVVLGFVCLFIAAVMANRQDAKESGEVDETLEKF